MNFTAAQGKLDEMTKATIDSRDIKWSSDDKLSVFDRIDNREFLLEGEGGSTSDLKFVGFNSVSIYSTTISGDANQETGYGIAW